MKRALLVAAIVAAIAGHLTGSPNQGADPRKQAVKQQDTPSMVTVVNNYQRTEPAKGTQGEAPKGNTTPEWALVAVGIVTFLVIGWQSVETRRAAQAAKLSAGALVNAERPWLTMTLKSFTLDDRKRIDWLITNTGRTTALIVEAKMRCRKHTALDKLPDVPDYREPIQFFGVPIAPSNSLDAWCYMEPREREYERLSPTDIGDIEEKGHDLVAYGYVKYLDSFGGEPHESRFCYYYATFCKDFRINLNAPREYHKCT